MGGYGGAIGIGFELAREAIARGAAAVSLIDIADCSKAVLALRDEAADGVSAVFRAKIASFKADVSNFDEISKAIADCEAAQGPLDIIIANAGIGPCGMFLEEAGVAHWEKVMRINFMGVVCTLKAALPGMVSRNKGRVIVTNSSGGFMGAAGISAYCGSKFAVRGFLDSLRLELIHTDVCVHMACPGFVNTTMIRQAQKEAVARYTWRGVERGQYVIGSPDTGGNMLIGSSLAASSARYYPASLEFFLAPLFVLLHTIIRRAVEASTRKVLTAAELQLPLSSAKSDAMGSKDE
ncbi:NAD(P)-binding protein [Coccomyxa subellipsoidea C-169]|uniref:NAD(P)-binding protein n=1 Tax=Coccomyxa subellipsoidea (strain C-169) TaxID=574566 RepID=I0YPZ0_COCSC|nr:NAD(P)-binding protein [Coccomyxa subellipsoidea C-169]EIE20459.1 NAD(P)-binding protein [Coccomyxa subellipsoidea C-169]|eukprot:XP_005645003.1 NAD(P)-binding protein [Coccomyxa subellipsoidea C-169]